MNKLMNNPSVERESLVSEGVKLREEIIFEKGRAGTRGYSLPNTGIAKELVAKSPYTLKEEQRRTAPLRLPEVSEGEVVRHFTRLSTWNYAIDTNFYPLGSCTMKYNPRINEEVAADPDWYCVHPMWGAEETQGTLGLVYQLEQDLMQLTGMEGISLQPAAGAHGELTGLFLIRDYFKDLGEKRDIVLIPDSAHGTNPASCTLAGMKVKTIKSNADGLMDVDQIRAEMGPDVACLMLTNPNTLGVFEDTILEISSMLKENGSLLYMDGANMNAILSQVSLGKMGVDVCHLNLHKTFSTPHGGGGPGSGPVVVSKTLVDFLPGPKVRRVDDGSFEYFTPPKSIGRVKGGYGHFGMFIRAYTYIQSYGNEICQVSEKAVLNANYMSLRLREHFHSASSKPVMHEAVFSDKLQKPTGVTTLDIAKTLLDFGFHPPTIYFPLIVSGALMIEPTETESVEEMDRFIAVLIQLAEKAKTDPEFLKDRPKFTFIKKIDEVTAAREPRLNYFSES